MPRLHKHHHHYGDPNERDFGNPSLFDERFNENLESFYKNKLSRQFASLDALRARGRASNYYRQALLE